MRPLDLAAIGLTLATCLLVVQATWSPPLVSPAEVDARVGERVRMQGMVLELRQYDDTRRFILVAEGAAVHARAEGLAFVEDTWVEVTGTIDREGGRPLLRVESVQANTRRAADHVDLVMLAREPASHADRLITVQGYMERSTLEGKGVSLRTTTQGDGPATLQGILRYEARCVCYIFHVDRPWTP